MTKQFKKISLLAAIATLGLGATTVFAQVPDNDGYVFDTRGKVVRSGTDLCWRTNRWTPAMAIEECDADLLKKPEQPVAVASAPAPAPAPAAAPVKPAAEKVTLAADALFDFDKAVLRQEGKAKLDDLSNKIKDIKLEVILAVGHTDRIGTDAYNQKLSEKRAGAVKAYLLSKGVDANLVHAEGKGEKQPVTGDKCGKGMGTKNLLECLQPDRRVEIEVIGTKEAK